MKSNVAFIIVGTFLQSLASPINNKPENQPLASSIIKHHITQTDATDLADTTLASKYIKMQLEADDPTIIVTIDTSFQDMLKQLQVLLEKDSDMSEQLSFLSKFTEDINKLIGDRITITIAVINRPIPGTEDRSARTFKNYSTAVYKDVVKQLQSHGGHITNKMSEFEPTLSAVMEKQRNFTNHQVVVVATLASLKELNSANELEVYGAGVFAPHEKHQNITKNSQALFVIAAPSPEVLLNQIQQRMQKLDFRKSTQKLNNIEEIPVPKLTFHADVPRSSEIIKMYAENIIIYKEDATKPINFPYLMYCLLICLIKYCCGPSLILLALVYLYSITFKMVNRENL